MNENLLNSNQMPLWSARYMHPSTKRPPFITELLTIKTPSFNPTSKKLEYDVRKYAYAKIGPAERLAYDILQGPEHAEKEQRYRSLLGQWERLPQYSTQGIAQQFNLSQLSQARQKAVQDLVQSSVPQVEQSYEAAMRSLLGNASPEIMRSRLYGALDAMGRALGSGLQERRALTSDFASALQSNQQQYEQESRARLQSLMDRLSGLGESAAARSVAGQRLLGASQGAGLGSAYLQLAGRAAAQAAAPFIAQAEQLGLDTAGRIHDRARLVSDLAYRARLGDVGAQQDIARLLGSEAMGIERSAASAAYPFAQTLTSLSRGRWQDLSSLQALPTRTASELMQLYGQAPALAQAAGAADVGDVARRAQLLSQLYNIPRDREVVWWDIMNAPVGLVGFSQSREPFPTMRSAASWWDRSYL